MIWIYFQFNTNVSKQKTEKNKEKRIENLTCYLAQEGDGPAHWPLPVIFYLC